MTTLVVAVAVAAAVGALASLASEEDTGSTGTVPVLPASALLSALARGWNELRPGGAAACSRGQPFGFFVRPPLGAGAVSGAPAVARVLVEFEGGGACWDARTCRPNPSSPFKADVGFTRLGIEAANGGAALPGGFGAAALSGVYDGGNPANPFPAADWMHVYVPYCTGDLHWGNATRAYGPGVTVLHRGAVNAGAAVGWVVREVAVAGVAQVVVTGCSAGGYGAAMWGAHLAAAYPTAKFLQVSAGAPLPLAVVRLASPLTAAPAPLAVSPSFALAPCRRSSGTLPPAWSRVSG